MELKQVAKLKLPLDYVSIQHEWINCYEAVIYPACKELKSACLNGRWKILKQHMKTKGITFDQNKILTGKYTIECEKPKPFEIPQATDKIATITNLNKALKRISYISKNKRSNDEIGEYIFIHLEGGNNHAVSFDTYRLAYHKLTNIYQAKKKNITIWYKAAMLISQVLKEPVYLYEANKGGTLYTDGVRKVYLPKADQEPYNYQRILETTKTHQPVVAFDSKALKEIFKPLKKNLRLRFDRLNSNTLKMTSIQDNDQKLNITLKAMVTNDFEPFGMQLKFLQDLITLFPDALILEKNAETQSYIVDGGDEFHIAMPIKL